MMGGTWLRGDEKTGCGGSQPPKFSTGKRYDCLVKGSSGKKAKRAEPRAGKKGGKTMYGLPIGRQNNDFSESLGPFQSPPSAV